ncbi:MAG TPA: ABC transporter permease subunit [Anaerolineaceae bacterium]|nr:ABC transporter permease subunit [Anaerolineaceae bacterium]
MKWNIILAIAKKDWLEVRQNTAAWLPMVIVPIVFVVLLPLLFLVVIPAMGESASQSVTSDKDLLMFMQNLPPSMASALVGLDVNQSSIVLMLGYMFAPMFLILPIMFSTVVACESFAGERERKTMEALLYTPASDGELFLGKVAAAAFPALLITWVSFALYVVIVNTVGYPLMGKIWFPLPTWWPLIFWISPALAAIGIAVTVLISARVQTFMGAYQTSASLVVLVLALMIGQVSGVLYLSVEVGLLVGLIFWVIAAVLSYFAIHTFNRTALLASKA